MSSGKVRGGASAFGSGCLPHGVNWSQGARFG
jgi:hypothetical protein